MKTFKMTTRQASIDDKTKGVKAGDADTLATITIVDGMDIQRVQDCMRRGDFKLGPIDKAEQAPSKATAKKSVDKAGGFEDGGD